MVVVDFYFTDRKFNLIEIASTDGQAPYQLSVAADLESINAGARTLSGTLVFTKEQANRINQMAALGNYVLYHDKFGNDRFMTIMDIRHDPLNGTHDFTAEDAGVDLINETIGAYAADKAYDIAYYINKFTYDSGFEIGVNEISTLSRKLKWDSTDETSLARILSVATQFDAELDFSFEISGTNVVKRYINIYKHRGADNQIRLYLDKDINNIVTTGDIYDLYTSVYATGGTPEGSDKPITLKGYKWTDPDGRYELGADGILRDTVAVQLWSRILSNDNPNPTKHHLQRSKSYEASTQTSLLQSALGGLKKAVNPAVNYEVDIAVLPENIEIGDTVHIVDDNEDLYLSARVLELKYDYALEQYTATLGDYLIEVSTVDEKLKELADNLKEMPKAIQYYPWVRYADDASGAGFSAFPTDKAYMAIVFGKVSTPSDNPSDYAGKWVKVLGPDGSDGLEGPKGDDGQTTYFHKAYANSSDGKTDFSITDPANKAYLGTCSDFTKADPTDPAKYLWQLVKGDKGDKGNDGLPGKDGVGLATTTVTYQASTSGTTVPSDTWSASVPTVTKGQYLWTRTIWTYTDNSSEVGYSVAYVAKDGNSGSDGIAGKDGVGIKSTVIEYVGSTSGITKPTSGWSATIPSVPGGQYLWTRTTWTYTDNTTEQGFIPTLMGAKGDKGDKGLQGLQGNKGDQGIQGPKGTDGKSSYTHIAYGTSSTGAGFTQTPSASTTYIGMYVDQTATDSTDPTKYKWTLIKGANGANGTPGKPGADGKTPYLHIAYADSADGTNGFYVSGARNLLLGTRDFSGINIQGDKVAVTNGQGTFQAATGTQGSSAVYDIANFNGLPLEKDTDYTASFWVKTSENTNIWSFLFDSGSNGNYADGATINQATTDYTRFVVHFHNGNNTATPSFIPVRIQKPGVTVWVYGCMLEEGTVAHPWSPAPSEAHPIYMGTYTDYTQSDSLDPTKYQWIMTAGAAEENANQYTDDAINDVNSSVDNIYDVLGNKADADEFKDLQDQAQALQDSYQAFVSDGGQYQSDLSSLEDRTTQLYMDLGDKLLQLSFVNTWFKAGEEGLSIGSADSSVKMLLSNDQLSFTDGGQTVAYFTAQSFYINKGAVVTSLQVNMHKLSRIDDNHTAFVFIG